MIVGRPVVTEQMSPDWRALRNAPGTEQIRLEGLAPADALALARHRLDVDSLPPEVAERSSRSRKATRSSPSSWCSPCVTGSCHPHRIRGVSCGRNVFDRPIRQTVQALVDSRIDGLSLQHQDAESRRSARPSLRRCELSQRPPWKPETDDLQKQLDTLTDLELLRVTDGPSGRPSASSTRSPRRRSRAGSCPRSGAT